jgi:flagellar biosynthetic protein FliO
MNSLTLQRAVRWWRAQPRWKQFAIGIGAAAAFGLFALSLLPAPRPAETVPGLAPEPVSELGLAVRVLLNLGLVIGLIYGSLALLRRWQGGATGARPARQLAVLETTRLSPRQAVHLLKVGERTLLLGATDQAVTLLAELEPQAEIEAAPVAGPSSDRLSFAEALRRVPDLNRWLRA